MEDHESHAPEVVARMRSWFGFVGLVIGSLGLCVVFSVPHIEEAVEPQQDLGESIADAGEKLVGRIVDRMRGKPQPLPPPPAGPSWKWYCSFGGTVLGLIGLLCGLAGWVRREDHRLAGAAMAVGATTIGGMYLVVGISLAVGIALFLLFMVLLGLL